MKGLTSRQLGVLAFIIDYLDDKGYTPSMRDIADNLGGVSTNAVEGHLKSLEKKGYIARTPRIARSLRVLKKMPKAVAPAR
jgi:repressor LexA